MTDYPIEILEHQAQWQAEFESVWLAHFQATGETKWDIYNKPDNKITPAGPGVDLAHSKLVLISTAGGYLAADQTPFDAANLLGDYSIRRVPATSTAQEIAFAHDHYDHTAVNADMQVLLPLNLLHHKLADGELGALATDVISLMGYQPNAAQVVDETIPAIVAAAQEMEATAALLVPS